MRKLIEYIFKSHKKKYLAQSIRAKRFVNYKNAQSILLLFESDIMEKNLLIKRIVEQFKAEGKKVISWGYVKKKTTDSATYPDYRIINKKSCNWYQKPDSKLLDELVKNKYDLLIDLTLSDDIPLRYLLLYANADCKAGVAKSDETLLDFKLQLPTSKPDNTQLAGEDATLETKEETLIDHHFVYNQLIFYLKTIQSND
ncbi:MAG: DUF6913 domain-containing protein [Paludibacteraceae bacterium]